jgi:RND family efflux transporter MFP subunit
MVMPKSILKKLAVSAGLLALVVLILYTGGFLTGGRIKPQDKAPAPGGIFHPRSEVKAQKVIWPQCYEAVGTVRPRTETKVDAQVSGRVLQVKVRPGDRVREKELLVALDDQEYKARLAQSRQDLQAARAALDLAKSEYGRLSRLLELKAAPKRDVDRTQETLQRTQAAVTRAEKQVEEVTIALSYTKVLAPEAGQVVQRLIEPGDLALPGRPLVILQTGGVLRLEAMVREGLIQKVRLRQELRVEIPALGQTVPGVVDEIMPSADPQTRSFLVKVVLPHRAGLYSGMFGRLMIPVGEQEVVVAPAAAVKRVGQLEMVLVKRDGTWHWVHVTTGRARDGQVEILSGLAGGEILGQD